MCTRTHPTPIFYCFHWLPIKFRIYFKVLVLKYRVLHGQSSVWMSDLLNPGITSRSRRSSNRAYWLSLVLALKCNNAFREVALTLWNTHPLDLKCSYVLALVLCFFKNVFYPCQTLCDLALWKMCKVTNNWTVNSASKIRYETASKLSFSSIQRRNL